MEELLNYIQKTEYTTDNLSIRSDVRKIKHLAEKVKFGKWIPISDHPPKDPKEGDFLELYLVDVWGYVRVMTYVFGQFKYLNSETGNLTDPEGPVRAWMPLPEPYKGD